MVSFLFLLLVTVANLACSTRALQSIIYACDYFTSDVCEDDEGTNNAMMNYGSCFFSACGGHEVVVSNYANCVGDTFLRLYDNNGYELSHQNDVYWDYENKDNCSEISFSIPSSVECKRYESRVGCVDSSNCAAQVSVNVTEVSSEYVRDVIKHPEGDSWNQACPKFNVSGSKLYFDPSETTACSFELCPGEYYRAFIRNCQHSTQVDLFSYSDVQYSNYNLACEDDEDNDKVEILYFDTIGHDSCRLFSFYSFCDSSNPLEWCSGQVVLTKRTFPNVGITWSAESQDAKAGDELTFTLSDMTIDSDYWNFGEVSFWVVVYKTDMLDNQEHCGYRDYTNYDFFDYVGYFEWFAEGGEFKVLNITGGNYTVDSFGGNYSVALYAWSDNFHAASQLSISDTLTIEGADSMLVTVHEYGVGESNEQLVSGAWRFSGSGKAEEGDVIVVVPVDHKGHCSVHGQPGTHDAAIFEVDVGAQHAGQTYGTFDFTIPHCTERFQVDTRYHEPFYEVQYIRNFEVLSRVTAANESVSDPHDFSSESESYFDTLGLEHLFAVIAIVASIAFASAYYMRVRNESRGMSYGGLDCFSAHDDDEDMVVLNKQDDSSYQL